MATKKFIIEMEEGESNCIDCPLHLADNCMKIVKMFIPKEMTCWHLNLDTIKIKEYEDKD